MRGGILNPMSGFTTNFFPNNLRPQVSNLHVQEMSFWMWRVRSISLTVNITIHLPEGFDPPTSEVNMSDTYSCPLNGLDPASGTRNEEDQIYNRVGFRNNLDGMASPAPPFDRGYSARFCEGAFHNPFLSRELGWALPISLRVFMPEGTFDTEPPLLSPVLSGINLRLTAFDPIFGITYNHLIPIWTTELITDSTVSGEATIRPDSFYPWSINGVPYYDVSTGQVI